MRDFIRFRLGQAERTLRDVDPTMTVLEYLRGPERLCGTKEGCAEGDCGACTVVLVDAKGRHQAVNACVLFLPALDGRQLLTVEHVAAAGWFAASGAAGDGGSARLAVRVLHAGVRHVAVRAADASQSRIARRSTRLWRGICAVARDIGRSSMRRWMCALGICRRRPRICRVPDGSVALAHGGKRSFSPRTSDELARILLDYPEATIVAGGTDVGLWVTKQHRTLPVTVSLDAVADLRDDRGDRRGDPDRRRGDL